MSTTLLWTSFADTDCDSFNYYRAITGLTIAFPNSLVSGDQLIFSATNSVKQTVTLSGSTAASLVSDIGEQAQGLSAALNQAGTSVLIRVTSSLRPRFQLFPCTFATHTGQLPRVVVPKLEYILIGNTARAAEVYDYTYVDLDGDPLDWYRMTTVKSSVESIPTVDMRALITPENLCLVVGRVIDPQNKPLVQAKVVIEISPEMAISDNSGISGRKLEVTTDLYGRFAVPLLQGHTVLFRIQSIGYNQVVIIPKCPYVLFRDLLAVNDQLFNVDRNPCHPWDGV